MDPNKPQFPGAPGAVCTPDEALIGRGRSLLLPLGNASFGRGRGFELLANVPGGEFGRGLAYPDIEPSVGLARGLPLPSDDGGFGRARGLFLSAVQPSVGLGRGALLPMESSVTPPPLGQPTKPDLPQGMPSLQAEEEEVAKKSQDQVHFKDCLIIVINHSCNSLAEYPTGPD